MNYIQSYTVSGWEVIDTPTNGEIILAYLSGDDSAVIRLRAFLLFNKYADTVTETLDSLRNGTEVRYSASGKFYVNGLLWEIYTDELESGGYRSYLLTEYNHHCIVACVDLSGPEILVIYQRDLKTLLRSIALTCLLNENATLELPGASVTVYSQTDVSVNENSNTDALFFMNNERYIVFFLCTDDSDSFMTQADTLVQSLFDEQCMVKRIMLTDDCAKYFVQKNGIVSYCVYTTVMVGEYRIGVLAHNKSNRQEDLLSEFRIEVVYRDE